MAMKGNGTFLMNVVSTQNGKVYKITQASYTMWYIGSTCTTLSQRVPGIQLQKVQVLIPTTSILNVHCQVELIELHPSDNREEVLLAGRHTHEEFDPASSEQRSCFPPFLLREGPLDVHVVPSISVILERGISNSKLF